MSEPRIVHRDRHLVVVHKPPGLATTSPDGPSLVGWLHEQDGRAPRLHPLSRLDAPVSGLVPFARTRRANEVALQARRRGAIARCYLALAASAPRPPAGRWRWSVGLHPRDPRLRQALPPEASGAGVKRAASRYELSAEAPPLVALRLWPETGRTHQLRVHAARAGCALLGDAAYGGARRLTLPDGRVLSARRVMLHCAAWSMPDPSAPGERLALTLTPDDDMLRLWERAGGDPAALRPAQVE